MLIFELDAKDVVNALQNPTTNVNEFGLLIEDFACKVLLCQLTSASIVFVRKQANVASHCLARMARSYASPNWKGGSSVPIKLCS